MTNHNIEEKQLAVSNAHSDTASGDEKIVLSHREETAHEAAVRGHLATDEYVACLHWFSINTNWLQTWKPARDFRPKG